MKLMKKTKTGKSNYFCAIIALCIMLICMLSACGKNESNSSADTSAAQSGNSLNSQDNASANPSGPQGSTSTDPSGSQDNASANPSDSQGSTSSNPSGSQDNASANPSDSQGNTSSNPSDSQGSTSTDPSGTQNNSVQNPSSGEGTTPVSLHGALHVDGTDLVDQNGEKFQLYGMSTHGLAWFPQYVNYDAFKTLRDDWNTNCVRLAMYTAEYNGYCTGGNKEELKALVRNGVEYATDLDMYVIIDWHILSDQDPNVYKEDSLAFFREMSAEYAEYDNVIYEICNEPNGYASWSSVKSYAEEVIPVIRGNDEDAVILVGSPTWSQDIHQAAADPLDYENIMYTLHFYAGTHKDDLRSRLETCVNNGLPVFVSEFGMCDASGNGANDFESAGKWMDLIKEHNISFFCWNLANKAESSSVIQSGNEKVSDWTEDDLSEAGKWIREYFRSK